MDVARIQASTPAPKVLVFGFSVTEQRGGFADLVAKSVRLEDETIEFEIVGLGGVHPHQGAYLFDAVVPHGRFDAIVLELMTTSYRADLERLHAGPRADNTARFGLPIAQIIAKAARRSDRLLMVNLPRRDVEYHNDSFTSVCRATCGRLGVTFVDVASSLSKEKMADLISDQVHTKPAGAKHYADAVAPVLLDLMKSPPKPPLPSNFLTAADTARAQPVPALAPHRKVVDFNRRFQVMPCVQIDPDEDLTVSLFGSTYFAGLSFVLGPRSGTMLISSPDWDATASIPCYDQFAYYSRLSAHVRPTALLATSLIIKQSAALPQIALLKGEKDEGPRCGLIAHIFTTPEPLEVLVEKFRWVWT